MEKRLPITLFIVFEVFMGQCRLGYIILVMEHTFGGNVANGKPRLSLTSPVVEARYPLGPGGPRIWWGLMIHIPLQDEFSPTDPHFRSKCIDNCSSELHTGLLFLNLDNYTIIIILQDVIFNTL